MLPLRLALPRFIATLSAVAALTAAPSAGMAAGKFFSLQGQSRATAAESRKFLPLQGGGAVAIPLRARRGESLTNRSLNGLRGHQPQASISLRSVTNALAPRSPMPFDPASIRKKSDAAAALPVVPHGEETAYLWPVPPAASQALTSPFGPRKDPFTGERAFHAAIDIAAAQGTPVLAAASGKVVEAGMRGRLGNFVKLEHADGTRTVYGHLSRMNVAAGDAVRQGQKIAEIGSTGRSTGPHLDFSLHRGGKAVNPLAYVTPPSPGRQLARVE